MVHYRLRPNWLQIVAGALQVAAGLATAGYSRTDIVRKLLPELPPPVGPVEELLLDGLLYRAIHGADAARRMAVSATRSAGGIPAVSPRSSPAALARNILETQFRQPLHVAQLARQVGMNAKCLCRIFAAEYGSTPHQYLITVRAKAAAALLLNTETKTEAIHALVGYRSRSTLYRDFARVMRTTPAAYRRENEIRAHIFGQQRAEFGQKVPGRNCKMGIGFPPS